MRVRRRGRRLRVVGTCRGWFDGPVPLGGLDQHRKLSEGRSGRQVVRRPGLAKAVARFAASRLGSLDLAPSA